MVYYTLLQPDSFEPRYETIFSPQSLPPHTKPLTLFPVRVSGLAAVAVRRSIKKHRQIFSPRWDRLKDSRRTWTKSWLIFAPRSPCWRPCFSRSANYSFPCLVVYLISLSTLVIVGCALSSTWFRHVLQYVVLMINGVYYCVYWWRGVSLLYYVPCRPSRLRVWLPWTFGDIGASRRKYFWCARPVLIRQMQRNVQHVHF